MVEHRSGTGPRPPFKLLESICWTSGVQVTRAGLAARGDPSRVPMLSIGKKKGRKKGAQRLVAWSGLSRTYVRADDEREEVL